MTIHHITSFSPDGYFAALYMGGDCLAETADEKTNLSRFLSDREWREAWGIPAKVAIEYHSLELDDAEDFLHYAQGLS